MNSVYFTPEELRAFVARSFMACGMTQQSSEIAADVLCYADLHGIDTHGIINLERIYLSGLIDGRIDPNAEPEVVHDFEAIAVIDGHDGLGLYIAVRAMDLAIAKAERFGVGVVTVRRSSHFGSAGYYASRALSKDMIGIAMTNLGDQAIARPPLGLVKMLGTNPISMAAPAVTLPPFVLDMSTTVVSTGKIRAAQRKGEQIPTGWLVDDAGNSVQDPWAYDNRTGHLQFLGGSLETGGYKGYGLALMVDILCGILSGANVGPQASLPLEANAKTSNGNNIGHFFLALDLASFCSSDRFKRRMDETLSALLNCPSLSAEQQVIYPGYGEEACLRKRLLEGIPIEEAIYVSLCKEAQRLGVKPPVRL